MQRSYRKAVSSNSIFKNEKNLEEQQYKRESKDKVLLSDNTRGGQKVLSLTHLNKR